MNYGGNTDHPTPVGIYPWGSTPEDICDLAGNVWEWCADEWDEYGTATSPTRRWGAQATARVIRGGSWAYGARNCRAAFRSRYLGFRVAAVPPGT